MKHGLLRKLILRAKAAVERLYAFVSRTPDSEVTEEGTAKREYVLNEKMRKIAERDPHFNILSDHPLKSEAINTEDFNLNYHLGPIFDILRDPDTKPPMAIAIYGEWGAGKTTAMEWLEAMVLHWNDHGKVKKAKRKKIEVKPVWFYPWKYDKKEDVWRGLIAEVILASIQVKGADVGTITKAAKQFGLFLGRSFLHSLSAVSEIPGIKIKGKEVASAISNIVDEFQRVGHPEKAYLNQFESALQEWVNGTIKGDKRLVIFVDDLDRCLPEIALQVLEALKLYLNIEKLIFVIGVDREVIDRLIAFHYGKQGFDKDNPDDRRKFGTYLAKIFQVEVHLAPTLPQIEGFLDRCLSKDSVPAWHEYLDETPQKVFRKLIKLYGGRTPREIKRRINSSLREGMGGTKVVQDGNEQLACAQGMQLYFIREELRSFKDLLSMLGDGDIGDEFFRTWSRIVVDNYKEGGDFPLYLDIKDIEGLKQSGESGEPGPPEDQDRTGDSQEKKKTPEVYDPIVTELAFEPYWNLLANENLGLLMQIRYPERDSPLLSNVAIVSRKIQAETSDDQIILERICRQLRKSENELVEKDFQVLQTLYLNASGIKDFALLKRLKNLQRLSLGSNRLATLPDVLGELTTLKELFLGGNRLTVLPEAIGELTALQELSLVENQLTRLPEAIGKLKALQTLNLFKNQLTTLPKEIGELRALRELNLNANQLKTVPEAIFKLTALRGLSLIANQLTTLPEAIGELTALQALDLHENQLTTLPEAIGELKALQALGLGRNQLKIVPEEIGKLTTLQELDLRANQLTRLPEAIAKLTELQELNLKENQLTALPEAIGKLTALKKLRLDRNQLTSLPDVIGELAALKILTLAINQLTTLPDAIGNLAKLQWLFLTENQLTELPEAIGELGALEDLDLQKNQLSSVPEAIGKLAALQHLNLNANQLKTVPQAIFKLTALRGLFLAENQLTTLPRAIGKLTALQTLSLNANQLTTLPEAIGKLTALQTLSLNSNQLTTLPEAIGKLTALQTLSLDANELTTLPEGIGELNALRELDLKENSFSEQEKERIRRLVPQDCQVFF